MERAKKSTDARPTIGRILNYTYARHDYAVSVEAVRPAIVTAVDVATDDEGNELDDFTVDLCVFTSGLRDFVVGRDGSSGILTVRAAKVVAEPAPGAAHWPRRPNLAGPNGS